MTITESHTQRETKKPPRTKRYRPMPPALLAALALLLGVFFELTLRATPCRPLTTPLFCSYSLFFFLTTLPASAAARSSLPSLSLSPSLHSLQTASVASLASVYRLISRLIQKRPEPVAYLQDCAQLLLSQHTDSRDYRSSSLALSTSL